MADDAGLCFERGARVWPKSSGDRAGLEAPGGHFADRLSGELSGARTGVGGPARGGRYAGPSAPWVYVHEDQLSDRIGPLAREPSAGVILIEHHWKASLRPYHRQRLALVWANQRHFALELARAGRRVCYFIGHGPLREVLPQALQQAGASQVCMMEAAEFETRADLEPLVESGAVRVVPHEGWLTTRAQLHAAHAGHKGPPAWKMDSFYRVVRKQTGVLMEADGSYAGGKVSFDSENRSAWSAQLGEPSPPEPPTFTPDAVTREVLAMVASRFGDHPGRLDERAVPATVEDAAALWSWAKARCLPTFGPYEDAMSVRSRGLWHTRISGLVNLHRLLPREVVADAEVLTIPLSSKEGFIRQVLGWREFVKHVHDETRGFRAGFPSAEELGDGGHGRWAGLGGGAGHDRPAAATSGGGWMPPVGASPCVMGNSTPLPPAYWGVASGMHCLDHVVQGVWEDAWSHHITRLMILSNLATLLDVDARELTDWFWVAYSDAWDWVVEPNVLAMGTYSVGPLMTTKPYVSGSAYIDKMSDYCEGCAFDPKTSCPITRLYWAFLVRHDGVLKDNPRMMMPVRSLAKRSADQRAADARIFVAVRDVLVKGQRVTPGLVERAVQGVGGEGSGVAREIAPGRVKPRERKSAAPIAAPRVAPGEGTKHA